MGLIELIIIEQVEIGYLMMKKKEENPLGRPSVEFGTKFEKLVIKFINCKLFCSIRFITRNVELQCFTYWKLMYVCMEVLNVTLDTYCKKNLEIVNL